MRISVLLTCVSAASALAFAAHAQDTQSPPTDQPMTQAPAPSDAPPPADTMAPPPAPSSAPATDAAAPAPAAPPPSAYNAAPTGAPPAGQIVMGPPQPQVQSVAPPPADYPVCSKTVKDACRNARGS